MTAKVKDEVIEDQHIRLLNKTRERWAPAVASGLAVTHWSYCVTLEERQTLRENGVNIR